MESKSVKPKLRPDQIARYLRCSGSFSQRYRQDKNKLSPDEIPPNSNISRQKVPNTSLNDNSHLKRDLKRPQRTSTAKKWVFA